MKPLSSVYYVKSNMKKSAPIFISTMLGVFLIYFFGIMMYSSLIGFENSNFPKEISIVQCADGNKLNDDIVYNLKNNDNVKNIIPVMPSKVTLKYYSIFGGSGVKAINMFQEDVEDFLVENDLELVGNIPEKNQNEIILPEDLAKQYDLDIDDMLEKDKDSDIKVEKSYKIVGIAKGKRYIPIICNPGGVSREEAKGYGIIYYLKDGENRNINKLIGNKISKDEVLLDYDSSEEELSKLLNSIKSFYMIIVLLMIAVISISLSNLNNINLINRLDEFKILNSIGYTKRYLNLKIFKENGFAALLGTIVGIVLSVIVIKIVNIIVWNPSGRHAYEFLIEPFIVSMISPMIIAVFSAVSSIKIIKNIDSDLKL